MSSIKKHICNQNNHFTTISYIDNLNKYIFDLIFSLNNYINNQLNINIRTSLPNNKIDNTTINGKTEYITYFNKHTISDIKNKLDKLTNMNQEVINNTITEFEEISKKNKQDCIFILFSSKLSSINDTIFIPLFIYNNNNKLIIKSDNNEIFNTNNYLFN